MHLTSNIGFCSQNFCKIFAEWNAKFCFSCVAFLREKKQHFAQLCAKVISRKILLYRICASLFCMIPLFRNVHIINDTLSWK